MNERFKYFIVLIGADTDRGDYFIGTVGADTNRGIYCDNFIEHPPRIENRP